MLANPAEARIARQGLLQYRRTVDEHTMADGASHGLKARGGRYGLQTMCEGGGQANVTIIERL